MDAGWSSLDCAIDEPTPDRLTSSMLAVLRAHPG